MKQQLKLYWALYWKLAALALATGAALRILLLFNEQTTALGFSALQWLQIYLLGAVNDLCAVTIGFTAVWLFLMLMTRSKYSSPTGYILLAVFTAAFVYVTFFNTIFNEYGSVVPLIASILVGYIAVSFALRLFIKGLSAKWATVAFATLLVVSVGSVIFNTVSEYVFWSEFGVRYNFIAVDYLVYTNEVIGNIMESYPIIPLGSALIAVTLGIAWAMYRKEYRRLAELDSWQWKAVAAPLHIAVVCGAVALMMFNTRFQQSDNVYANELQANGCYKFCDAFVKNELDFKQFYTSMPDSEATAVVYAAYGSHDDNRRNITYPDSIVERHPNIVLITIESMSAAFMEHFGNGEHLTPNLDSLYDRSLAFDKIFATGNRTVRGLEAVTLSLPPCAGQSIIKRDTKGKYFQSIGEILRSKGYSTTYFYGGNAYFDNMAAFFGGNGYEIVDRASYTSEEVTFENIWGVCDQDAFRKVISTLNSKFAVDNSAPFFAHVMSVSNHRPYTYPEGCISIPSDSKTRQGGVMYSDYALGEFFREAAKQEWFANTIFVVTADHCASSAGKTELPLAKYHIPAFIFAPQMIAPERISKTASQIDLMPTLLALMGMRYESTLFGCNILDENFVERAYMATYQDLGYLRDNRLTILSPVCRSKQFAVDATDDDPYRLTHIEQPDTALVNEAVAMYQSSAIWH